MRPGQTLAEALLEALERAPKSNPDVIVRAGGWFEELARREVEEKKREQG